jgi:hypothetical protein
MIRNLPPSARRAYGDDGVGGLARRSKWWVQAESVKALQPANDGVYVIDEDWDYLIIIDACQVDIFEACYQGGQPVQIKISRGASSGLIIHGSEMPVST